MVNPGSISKGLETAAKVIGTTTAVLEAADKLKKSAQCSAVLESDGAKEATQKAKGALGGIVKKVGDVTDTVGNAAAKASEAKDAHNEIKAQKKQERELAKQLKVARQAVLEGASQVVTYKEFSKRQVGSGIAWVAGPFEGPGCFALATYAALDFDKDLTDYLNIYVGKGLVLKDAITLAASREGDPDVYADVKYKQNVHVYAYPCVEDEIDEKYEALLSLFQGC